MVNEFLKVKNNLNLNLDSVFIVDSPPTKSLKKNKSKKGSSPNKKDNEKENLLLLNTKENVEKEEEEDGEKKKENLVTTTSTSIKKVENLTWKFFDQISILDGQLRAEENLFDEENASTSREVLVNKSNLQQSPTKQKFYTISTPSKKTNSDYDDDDDDEDDGNLIQEINNLLTISSTPPPRTTKPQFSLSNIMSSSGSPISVTSVQVNQNQQEEPTKYQKENQPNITHHKLIISNNNNNSYNKNKSSKQLPDNLINVLSENNDTMNSANESETHNKGKYAQSTSKSSNHQNSNKKPITKMTAGMTHNTNINNNSNMGFPDNIGLHLGLYGWRKKCLFTLILVLLLLIVINLILTLWILKVMEFSSQGMGQLKIVPGGIQLSGQALVMDLLRASTIRSKHGQPIVLESSRNFSINTRDSRGVLENQLFLGHDKLECLATGFRINDTNGRNLFSVNRNEVTIGAHSLKIEGEGGAIFRDSIQTPHVRAEAGRELRLESPTRQLEITAAKDIILQSRAGGLDITALDDIKLSAIEGSIRLESSKIFLPNLKTAQLAASGISPTQIREHSHRVFQLCACSNGKLFLAAPHSICAGDDSTVCR